MLRRLDIQNFVIVDHLELDFAGGFGALTGETGAGKSILIDALSLALGDKAEAGVVRSGAPRSEISAEFDAPENARAWLAANDFPLEEGVCLMRRVVDAAGRSRAYINGSTATLAQLRELGEMLADIHGQHAHHALLRADAQRELLDAQAGHLPLAREVREAYREWRLAVEARLAAERDIDAMLRERDMLEWQVRELDELGFDVDGWLEINVEHKRLTHAASLMEGVDRALAAISEEGAAAAVVEHEAARLSDLVEFDEGLKEAHGLLDAAAISLEEAAGSLRRYRDRLDLDPQRLEEVEARIEAVMALARKHRVPAEELAGVHVSLAERLKAVGAAADPQALQAREREAQERYLALGKKLSAGRAKTAKQLSAAVSASMQELALSGARFEIALEPLPEGGAQGLESVEFRVAANLNQPLRPLAKVASGGELSRIGLAIQVIASQAAHTPTLIFDEVDVGIGGRVAEIVGRLLKQLGASHQVMCVTHLPQVAAQADWQWSIAKRNKAGETVSSVAVLDDAGRIEEIARMLGGVNITATTRSHAAELLGLQVGVPQGA